MEGEPAAMLFDVLLAASLVGVGWQALMGRDLYRSIIIFLIFGVLLAITWARLDAPDLALAEAAIGAGLTGALFLKAVHRLTPERPRPRRAWGWRTGGLLLIGTLAAAVAAGIGLALWSLPAQTSGLRPLVEANLPSSGVSNPVTAVLINFRGYDTLLEIGVLLVAGAACWAHRGVTLPQPTPEGHLRALVALLTPLLVLVAGYLLWQGSFAPGGAFQAGALLAGGGVLRLLVGDGPLVAGWRGRALAVLGLGAFVLIGGLAPRLSGGVAFLALPATAAGGLIFAIEAACTLSVGYLLVLLYQGGRGGRP